MIELAFETSKLRNIKVAMDEHRNITLKTSQIQTTAVVRQVTWNSRLSLHLKWYRSASNVIDLYISLLVWIRVQSQYM